MKKLLFLILSSSCLIIQTNAQAGSRVTCSSFDTHNQAQIWYEQRKKNGQTGWKSLDRDKDGIACECLPGGGEKRCP